MALLFLFAVIRLGAQDYWQDEQVYTVGTLPHSCTHIPYKNAASALKGEFEESEFFMSLRGKWAFNWVEKPADRPIGFHKPDHDISTWDSIMVPSCLERMGYGKPYHGTACNQFRNQKLIIPGVPQDHNPVGSYRTTFSLPDSWKNRQVIIHFDGVSSAFYIWVNGEFVGYDEDSMTDSEFNLTPFLKKGENTIAVQVFRWSDGSYLEDSDMWTMSGIFRDVFLYSTDDMHIQDFFIRAELDENYEDARLKATVKLMNFKAEHAKDCLVELSLFNAEKQQTGKKILASKELGWHQGVGGLQSVIELSAMVDNPHLWSADDPYLYTVLLILKKSSGEIIEINRAEFGFREVEVKNNQLFVNGRPVLIKGVNRHEIDAEGGKTLSMETMIRDAKLMKQFNINAVRTSHHANDPRWYSICDRYGLYVMDEANLESSDYFIRVNGLPGSSIAWMASVLDRCVAMVERDKNHPSIIFWSLGNESGWGYNFALMSDYIRRFDSTRLISYDGRETDVWAVKDYFDINSSMYPYLEKGYDRPPWELLANWESPVYDKPYLMIEYGHAMGNALGNLEDYWEVIENCPGVTGGFIWDWVNQTFNINMPDGNRRQTHSIDFGDCQDDFHVGGSYACGNRPPDHCVNGLIFSDRRIQPELWEVKKVHQFIGIEPIEVHSGDFLVINNYHSLNLDCFESEWVLCREGMVVGESPLENLHLNPGEGRIVHIPVGRLEQGKEYTLDVCFSLKEPTLWADAGHVVAREQFVLQEGFPSEEPKTSEVLEISEKPSSLVVQGSYFDIVFDIKGGQLISLKVNDVECIAQEGDFGGPQLNLYRSPVDNDGIFRNSWAYAGLDNTLRGEVEFRYSRRIDGSVLVKVYRQFNIPGGDIEHVISYHIYGDGTIDIANDVAFEGFKDLPSLPRVGLKMALAEGMEQIEWYGRGPHENYPDRKTGAFLGKYSSTVTNLYTPYLIPQENGARCDIRWMMASFFEENKPSLLIKSENPFIFSALHYDACDLDRAIRPEFLTERKETILCIDKAMMGLGNGSCGSPTLRKYQLPVKPYHFDFTLKLISN